MQTSKLGLVAATLTLMMLGACASEAPVVKADPIPEPVEEPQMASKVEARTTSAKHAGAKDARQPIIELEGESPQGWKIKVKEQKDGNTVTLTAWAYPREGDTEEGEWGPFKKQYALKQLDVGATWTIVVKGDGGDLPAIEFTY